MIFIFALLSIAFAVNCPATRVALLPASPAFPPTEDNPNGTPAYPERCDTFGYNCNQYYVLPYNTATGLPTNGITAPARRCTSQAIPTGTVCVPETAGCTYAKCTPKTISSGSIPCVNILTQLDCATHFAPGLSAPTTYKWCVWSTSGGGGCGEYFTCTP